eukprot:CCRYP_014184-RA/>CCRYP_014184-RA protein AED:0.38 eAED:0.38 QI:59/1/0.66/1/0/0/3/0/59
MRREHNSYLPTRLSAMGKDDTRSIFRKTSPPQQRILCRAAPSRGTGACNILEIFLTTID